MRFLIQKTPVDKVWLDGYGGGIDWEWTRDRKAAWRLRKDEAERKLALVKNVFPEAMIVEA